jgi:hypothetical protein
MHYLSMPLLLIVLQELSADPYKAVDELIAYTLDRLAKISTLICSNYPICSFKKFFIKFFKTTFVLEQNDNENNTYRCYRF